MPLSDQSAPVAPNEVLPASIEGVPAVARTHRRAAYREVVEPIVIEAIDLLHAGLDFYEVAKRTGMTPEDVRALLRYPDVRQAAEMGGLAGLIELRQEAFNLQKGVLESTQGLLDLEVGFGAEAGEAPRLTPLQKLEVLKFAHQVSKDLLVTPYQAAATPTVQVTVGQATSEGGSGADVDEDDWNARLNRNMEKRTMTLMQVKVGG